MKYKVLIAFFLASSAAHAAPCSRQTLEQFQNYVLPDIKTNRDFVAGLFEAAAAGTIACDLETTRIQQRMSLAMCGVRDPVAEHVLRLERKDQVWQFKILQADVQCAGSGFWLKNVASKYGAITQALTSGDRIVVETLGCGNEKVEDYKAISFANGDSKAGKEVTITTLLNTKDEMGCEDKNVRPVVLEFSAKKLGLDDTVSGDKK